MASAQMKFSRKKKRPRPSSDDKVAGPRKRKRAIKSSRSVHQAVSLVKLVGITMRLREMNNHLQGLYAELGKIVYEKHHRGAKIGRVSKSGTEGLMDSIMEMRNKMDRLEREARLLKKAA